MWIREQHADVPARPISYPSFLDWRERSEAFDGMAAVRNPRMRFTSGDEARVLEVAMVTADYFRVIGVPPLLGRDFVAADDVFTAPAVAIVSHRFWETELGGRADSLGTQVVLNEVSYTVVGVTPRDLKLPNDPDAWIPMGREAAPDTAWFDRSVRRVFAIARLKHDRTIDEARADLARIKAQLARDFPVHIAGNEVEVLSLRDAFVGKLRLPLLLSLGAVGVLLVIVCVNVSNLLLLRAIHRQKELTIRAALGANRKAICAQLLGEALLLVLIGSVLGLLFAEWGTEFLTWALSEHLFEGTTIAVNSSVAMFALALAIAVGTAMSILPAWRSASADFRSSLNQGRGATAEPKRNRALAAFLVFQTSLAVVLLIRASLLVNSLFKIVSFDPGFTKDGVVTLRLLLPTEYRAPQQLSRLYARLIAELERVPGVDAVAVFNDLPGLEPRWQSDISPKVDGEYRRLEPGELINVDWRIVSADYFATMRIPIKGGRAFTNEEAEQGAPVMVIDESLANRFWPNGEAIGSHIRYDGPTEIEIVGVTANVYTYGVEEAGRITIYTPYGRFPFLGDVGVAMRTSAIDPLGLVASVRTVLGSVDPGIAIFDVATLEQRLVERIAPRTLTTQIFVLFAAFSGLLATIGIYSVMSYVVGQRRRELGLRIALGAGRREIVRFVIKKGVFLSAGGVVIGLLLAVSVSRMLSGLLFAVSSVSLPTYVLVAVAALATAAAACAMPAWRASRVDPLKVLKAE